jgi:sulfite reductase beta subunit-like hemoprotein
MTFDLKNLRLDGIYKQRQEGYFMQRVKLAAGTLSAEQARKIADVSIRFGHGTVHLTTRGSMEIHWLKGADLPGVKQELAKVGLTSRGACGGAVRGVTCSAGTAAVFPLLESLARRLQRHFTGNPRYETLPKKFKIGIEADTNGGRHLIQDVGVVLAGGGEEGARYDVWIAGGLGREPQPGFLFLEGVAEERLIPVIEAVIAVYARLAPPPKRLKYLARELGEAELRRLIEAEPAYNEELPRSAGMADNLTPRADETVLQARLFAGQLPASLLRELAGFAERHAGGVLLVTADQDLAFPLAAAADSEDAGRELSAILAHLPLSGGQVTFRVCPGTHECSMGLAPTREIAAALLDAMSPAARELVWALSGCPNSCSQPQLAAAGIFVSRLAAGEDGVKSPRFDLHRRTGAGLGTKVREQLTLDELTALVAAF